MARDFNYTKIGWEDGDILQPAKVNIQGTEYEVEPAVMRGTTPINANNLNKMDNALRKTIVEDLPSVLDVKLIAVTDTAPEECKEGDKYYNTTDKVIYTATRNNLWGSTKETPLDGILYVLFDEKNTFAWDGADLVSVGGGSGNSIYIGEEEPIDTDVKLYINEKTNEGHYDSMNYRNSKTNEWERLMLPPVGDTLPIGSVVDYDGDTIPYGWEEVKEITGQITKLNENITINSYTLIKIDNIVTFTITIVSDSALSNATELIQLPEGFWPRVLQAGNISNNRSAVVPYYLSNSTGKLVTRYATTTNMSMWLSLTYVAK